MTNHDYGPRFWIALAIGGALIAYGAAGLVANLGVRAAANVAAWLAGANLIDDLILLPLASLAGAILTRFLPQVWRAPVRVALLTTAVVLIVAYPALRGYGRDHVPDNPSVDPLNYATATATALAAVWAAAAGWLITGLVARARRRQQSSTRAL
jgi:hypothetical protein